MAPGSITLLCLCWEFQVLLQGGQRRKRTSLATEEMHGCFRAPRQAPFLCLVTNCYDTLGASLCP